MAPSKLKPKHRKKLLSSTRPPSFRSRTALSSQTTRSIIRQHHTLHKRLAQASAAGDSTAAASLQAQLYASGGLAAYQQASTQGQAADRGGDSSRVLVAWFREEDEEVHHQRPTRSAGSSDALLPQPRPLRLLEVGALRVDNACARSGRFDLTRIDLRSNHAEIAEQDFMQRPLPTAAAKNEDVDGEDAAHFDIVSLSLVLNYVSEPAQRGAMLQRVAHFLRHPPDASIANTEMLPGLFLVLPAPCVRNSRYLDEARLADIMTALGYECLRKKYTDKLAYFYWRYTGRTTCERFAKREIVKGGARNNFAIVLK